ncbi:hypothetical protein [Alcanivorax jadensis]|jgi:hypothetical protein|uniref:hypothetical protein n=1 Tax=Alcanivorax jadensis TaxID=64988 RepID=UPI000A487A90|nr:hypothetical protein [Alcanivorax jadensis]
MDYAIIIIPIFLALLISILIPSLNKGARARHALLIDEKALHTQGLFWLSLLTPIFLGTTLAVHASYEYDFKLGPEEYDFFIRNNKLSLIIIGAMIPATAVVSSIHRTIQAAAQITESEKKNISDSYYTHFRFYIDYFKSLRNDKNSKEINCSYSIDPGTFRFLYPDSSPHQGIGSYSQSYLGCIKDDLLSARKNLCIALTSKDKDEIQRSYVAASDHLNAAANLMTLDVEISNNYALDLSSESFIDSTPRTLFCAKKTKKIIPTYRFLRQSYFNIALFCGHPLSSYKVPDPKSFEWQIDYDPDCFSDERGQLIESSIMSKIKSAQPIQTY